MASVIRIKLVDFLEVLAADEPNTKKRSRRKGTQLKLTALQKPVMESRAIDDGELRLIQKYLKNGNASRRDMEFKFNMTSDMVLRRLDLLKERGVVKRFPGNVYGLTEEAIQCTLD